MILKSLFICLISFCTCIGYSVTTVMWGTLQNCFTIIVVKWNAFNVFVRKYLLKLVKHMMRFLNVILTVMVTGKSMLTWKNEMEIMKKLCR